MQPSTAILGSDRISKQMIGGTEKEPHSGGGLTALMECAALLGDGQQKCGPH